MMTRSKSMITLNKPESLVSESYKMFRTNLNYMNVDTDNKVILFTSSSAEEGKTTTVCNTAVEFARAGMKTLLVECDLRKARVHELFSLNQSPGLTNILVEGASIEDSVNAIQEVSGLDVLCAGPLPPTPSELAASKKMAEFITEARNQYDKILIDAPPVLTVTDAAILSRLVDGVIIISASEETRKEALLQAKKQLDKVKANILGVVLTKVDIKKSNYYYGYKSYYGDQGKKKKFRLFGKKKKVEYMSESSGA